MDQHGGWGPSEFQLASWPVQEQAAEASSPAAGLRVEYASIDMFGTCRLPAYVPHSWGEHHLIEYQYSAQDTDVQNWQVTGISSNTQFVDLQSSVFEQVESEIEDDINMMKKKMHRYPASLQALDERYTVPRYVAIGPYHHHRVHLKKAEKVKHAAAIRCVRESGHSLEELYFAVASVADSVRRLYDKDVMAGIGNDDFRHMMFFDACFLVQYMVMQSGERVDHSLRGFLSPNRIDIQYDVRLLENQLPWKVVETVMMFRSVSMPLFLSRYIYLQDHKNPEEKAPPALNRGYKPPHLLGLLRYNTVGGRSYAVSSGTTVQLKPKNRSVSVSALGLAEMGITLRSNNTMKLIDMGLIQEGALFAELSLASIYLNRDRASYLVNMAALELCTVKSFTKAPAEDSVVCSYLMFLALLVNREEDVQQLRVRGVLKGGGGLTNAEALHFFTSFQGLRRGPCYNRVVRDIEIYKENRQTQTKLYSFYYNNKKIIAAVITAIGVLVGIIGTLLSIKRSF